MSRIPTLRRSLATAALIGTAAAASAGQAPPPTRRGPIEWREEWLEASREIAGWIQSGRIKYRETIAEGLESAPSAFRGLLAGKNFGKQLVRVSG